MTNAATPSPQVRDARAVPDALAVSVVIAAFNAASTLEAQLDAIAAQEWTGVWELVIVDNASTDGTREIVEQTLAGWSRFRLIDATDGQGPAYARNVGARAARGQSLVFCDADDLVAPGWLAAMGDALAVHDFVSGPIELTRLNPGWLAESRGGTGTDGLVWFEGRFPFASSCNLGVNRALFLEQNGFDEALQVGEDIDLSMRLHLHGVDLTFAAGALIHYRYRPDLRATFERAIAYGAAGPSIAELWRARGGIAVSRWKGLRNWVWLVRHLGLLRSRAGQARWLWVAGQRLGSLRGSWTVRRLYV